MSITIKDIAKIAKVSHTTVSRALNNSPLIKEETKRKIKDIAEKYNYIPNYNAKSLVLDKSYNIGLFFSTLNLGTSATFFYDAVTGVNSIIKQDYNLIVKGIDDYNNFNLISNKNFDGIIVMSQSIKDDNFILDVQKKDIPIVVLNRVVDLTGINCILSDDKVGSYNAVQFLIRHGHKKIAIIKGKKGFQTAKERKAGYEQALMINGIKLNNKYIINGNYDSKSGYEGMKMLLNQKDVPTAVFCSNDDMAVGAIKAIKGNNLSVPNDISIIGFDDNGFSEFIAPSLTTVKRPIEKISKEGTKKLLEIINSKNEQTDRQVKYINTQLIIRESTSRI